MKEFNVRAKIVDYDPLGDSLFVKISGGKYEHSVDLSDIIFDLGYIDGERAIVGFEILDASKKFGITPYLLSRGLKSPHAEIRVTEKEISMIVSIEVLHRGKPRQSSKEFEKANEGLPPLVAAI